MTPEEFRKSLNEEEPPREMAVALAALWWEAKGNWKRAHGLVDALDSVDGMAVHAYLHRREGSFSNADYWYSRAGRRYYRASLQEEWQVLVDNLLEHATPA